MARDMLVNRTVLLNTTQCRFPEDLSQLFNAPSWEDPELQQSKQLLNEVKSRLDDMQNRDWEKAANTSNRAEQIRHMLRNDIQAELATVAWAKMYESICNCNLLPVDSPALMMGSEGNPFAFTAHLCEAPGAFISATNHFIRTHRQSWWWEWLGLSLNPHYEGNDQFTMIDDDKLIIETMEHWCWGADDSGDIRKLENMEALWESARQRAGRPDGGGGSALLVTADGAIETCMDPNRQEEITAALHFCEIVAAIGLLAPGGNFMWKGFTLFEHASLGSLYLMGCLFEQVAVYKPCTSKPANSEVYVVGRSFKGCPPEVLDALKAQVCPDDIFKGRSLFPRELLESKEGFMETARAAASAFAAWQGDAIKEALDRHASMSQVLRSALFDAKRWLGQQWFTELKVMRLDRQAFLAPHANLDGSNNNSSNAVVAKRKLHGTLQERQEQFQQRRAMISGVGAEKGEGGEGPGAGASALAGAGGSSAASAAAATVAAPPMKTSTAVEKMMASMGFKAGEGLGLHGQGINSAIQAEGNRGRAGLGAGRASGEAGGRGAGAVRADWAPQPDTRWLMNEGPLTAEEVGGWQAKAQAVPAQITKTKAIPDDNVLMALLSVTQEAAILGARRAERAAATGPSSRLAATAAVAKEEEEGDDEGFGSMGLGAGYSSGGGLGLGASAAGGGGSGSGSAGVMAFVKSSEAQEGTEAEEMGDTKGRGQADWDEAGQGPGSVKREGGEEEKAGAAGPAAAGVKGEEEQEEVRGGAGASSSGRCRAAHKLCQHTEVCLAPRGSSEGPHGRGYFKLAAVDVALGLLVETATAQSAPLLLDLSRRGSSQAEYVLERTGGATRVVALATEAAVALQRRRPEGSVELWRPEEGPELDWSDAESCMSRLWTVAQSEVVGTAASGATLVLGDLSSLARLLGEADRSERPFEMEHHAAYRRQCLWTAATALLCLAPGGCLLMRLGHTVTTLSSTLLFVLHRSFEKMWIGSTFASCAAGPERFLVLCGRMQDDGTAARLLLEALSLACDLEGASSARLPAGTRAVSEVYSLPHVLLHEHFYKYLASHTVALAQRQVLVINRRLKELGDLGEGGQEELPGGAERQSQREAALKQLERGPIYAGTSFTENSKAQEFEATHSQQHQQQQGPQPPGSYLPGPPPAGMPVRSAPPSFPASSWGNGPPPSLGIGSYQQQQQPGTNSHPHPQHAQQHQHPRQSAMESGVVQLCTMHKQKGKEKVCRLKLEPWPVEQLIGLTELVVYEYVAREGFGPLASGRPKAQIKAKPVSPEDACALKGFVDYLAGRNKATPERLGSEKVAVVRWGVLEYFLTLRVPPREADNPGYGLLLHV